MTSSPLPVSLPSAPASPPISQVPDSPQSQPSKFDNLYLDPPPAHEPQESPHEAIPQIPKPRETERTSTVFTKPELPPISYSKRTWVLHQHEDLQPRIQQVQQDLSSQADQRAALLANELRFFEQVNQTKKSLREKMLREDKRQEVIGVCWAYKLAVTECLKAGRNCTDEIAGWKKCEDKRD